MTHRIAFTHPFVAFVAVCMLLWSVLFVAGPPLARGARWSLRWIWHSIGRHRLFARSRQRLEPWVAYAPVAAVAIGGIMIAFALGEDFLELAVHLRAKDGDMLRVDQGAYAFAMEVRNAPLTAFFEFFTRIGGPIGLAVIVSVAATFLWQKGHRPLAIYLASTVLTGGLLNTVLKLYFQRARPDLAAALRLAHGSSFPSGHAMGGIVTMAALAYVLHRLHRRWALQSAGLAILAVAALMIGLSRVYLGVHWLSDIGAGFAAGIVWVAVATTSHEVWRRLRRLRTENKA